MPKTDHVELTDGTRVPILFEDRSVLALDKPAGWMLGPEDEERERRNLHLSLMDGIAQGQWWARCRNLRFIRFVHRLDAPTTGVLLMVKSPGAIRPFSELFSSRGVEKTYLAVTDGVPKESEWRCQLPLGPVPDEPGRHQVDAKDGKEADTAFKRLDARGNRALVEARPHTGRTHQIRLHLLAAGCPVVGDVLYGEPDPAGLALRAISLQYRDPFTGKPIRIRASDTEFKNRFGFGPTPVAATPGTGSPAPETIVIQHGRGTQWPRREPGRPFRDTPRPRDTRDPRDLPQRDRPPSDARPHPAPQRPQPPAARPATPPPAASVPSSTPVRPPAPRPTPAPAPTRGNPAQPPATSRQYQFDTPPRAPRGGGRPDRGASPGNRPNGNAAGPRPGGSGPAAFRRGKPRRP